MGWMWIELRGALTFCEEMSLRCGRLWVALTGETLSFFSLLMTGATVSVETQLGSHSLGPDSSSGLVLA